MLHNGGATLNDVSGLKLRNIYLPGFGVVSLYTTKTNKHNSDIASQVKVHENVADIIV